MEKDYATLLAENDELKRRNKELSEQVTHWQEKYYAATQKMRNELVETQLYFTEYMKSVEERIKQEVEEVREEERQGREEYYNEIQVVQRSIQNQRSHETEFYKSHVNDMVNGCYELLLKSVTALHNCSSNVAYGVILRFYRPTEGIFDHVSLYKFALKTGRLLDEGFEESLTRIMKEIDRTATFSSVGFQFLGKKRSILGSVREGIGKKILEAARVGFPGQKPIATPLDYIVVLPSSSSEFLNQSFNEKLYDVVDFITFTVPKLSNSIRVLHIQGAAIKDTSFLNELHQLEYLNLQYCSHVENISPPEDTGFSRLSVLLLDGTGITSLDILSNCRAVEVLSISKCAKLTNFDALRRFRGSLVYLDASSTKISLNDCVCFSNKLCHLSVLDCPTITKQCFESLPEELCFPSLVSLETKVEGLRESERFLASFPNPDLRIRTLHLHEVK